MPFLEVMNLLNVLYYPRQIDIRITLRALGRSKKLGGVTELQHCKVFKKIYRVFELVRYVGQFKK